MVPIEILHTRMHIPAPDSLPINPPYVVLPYESRPVIFRQKTPILLHPSLILYILRGHVLAQRWQLFIPPVGLPVREGGIGKAPEGAEFAQGGQCVVNEVLVRAGEVVANDPVEGTFARGECDIDEVRAGRGD